MQIGRMSSRSIAGLRVQPDPFDLGRLGERRDGGAECRQFLGKAINEPEYAPSPLPNAFLSVTGPHPLALSSTTKDRFEAREKLATVRGLIAGCAI